MKFLCPVCHSSLEKDVKCVRERSKAGMSGPKTVVKYPAVAAMRHFDRECFQALHLNTRNSVIAIEPISIGTLNGSLVHPREVFKKAIESNTCSIILVHNHPSGDPTPSADDLEITERLRMVGELVGIEVLDHVIVGNLESSTYYSLREEGHFNDNPIKPFYSVNQPKFAEVVLNDEDELAKNIQKAFNRCPSGDHNGLIVDILAVVMKYAERHSSLGLINLLEAAQIVNDDEDELAAEGEKS